MKIKKTITKLSLKGFTTGKICSWTDSVFQWRDFIFLFDVSKPSLIQLSSTHEVMGRWALEPLIEGIKGIDAVFYNGAFFIITDSLSKSLYKMETAFHQNGTIVPGKVSRCPLPAGAIIASIEETEESFVFLDKGNSLIRVLDKEFVEQQTVGSRMGYIYDHDDTGDMRLGFEFPEDMIPVKPGTHVVSDSGNKRLVVMDHQWKQMKTISLPEFPYRFAFCDNDLVVVSDFDRTLMVVSLTYGYLYIEELDHPVDFFQSKCNGATCLVGSENTGENEFLQLELPEVTIEAIAEAAENHKVLMRLKIDGGSFEEALAITRAHRELLPVFAQYTTPENADETFKAELKDYAEEKFKTTLERIEAIKEEVSGLSVQFIERYKAVPGAEDKEAANIEKEGVRRKIFLLVKEYRS
ncbi:MAG: hypothetical protein GY757_46150, partial [bacterium]|nr:hypothetical protein [bacterium]